MRFLIEGLTPTILLIVAAVAICIAFWELARWIAREFPSPWIRARCASRPRPGCLVRPGGGVTVAWGSYRKRPVVVQAIQYSRATRTDIIRATKASHSAIDDDGAEYETNQIHIPTLEGHHVASLDDWIVCGIKGEFYPVKPDIFEATYEHVPSRTEGT